MSSSKVLFFLCLSFILGVALQSIIKIPQIILWGFLFLAITIIFFSLLPPFYKYQSFGICRMAGFCILFIMLGILRFQITEFNIANNNLAKLNNLPEKITLAGKVVAEPDVRETTQRLKVKINILPDGQKADSVALVTTGIYPEYNYLDQIKITGYLKTPKKFDGFSYKNYLMKEGIYSIVDFPKVELVKEAKTINILELSYQKILFFKEKLKESINANFAPPQNFILEGIVLGNDRNMPKDLKEKMNTTGLSHLTAISGSNIVILSNIMMAFLLLLGFWRPRAFYISVIFIWLYILIAGFPASGIRAGIMGTIFLLAHKTGRQNASSRIIVLTAAIMLFENPMLIFYDAGFQLSFLASMGIIHLKPIIDSFLDFYKNTNFQSKTKEKIKILRDILSITMSAQIFTLPIIAYTFKNISLVSLPANLLVIPIVDFIMVAGFLSAFVGIFSGALGFIFSIPAWFSLSYFTSVVGIFYQPWAVVAIESFPVALIATYYLALAFSIKYLNTLNYEMPFGKQVSGLF